MTCRRLVLSPVEPACILVLFEWVRYVKNIASMAKMSHKDCGLDYSPMSQMVCSHVKKLANKIDVLDQSEKGLHQQKGNTKNRFSNFDEWD